MLRYIIQNTLKRGKTVREGDQFATLDGPSRDDQAATVLVAFSGELDADEGRAHGYGCGTSIARTIAITGWRRTTFISEPARPSAPRATVC